MKVAFVVLHYCQVNVTFDCINSLLSLKGDKDVVVVDNASPDGSGKLLNEKFYKHEIVHVILNDSNLGFASANNIGYAYAKKELGANVITVLNNDTVIEDDIFLEKLTSSIYLQNYHIIAPDIINRNCEHQNPFATKPLSYDECVRNTRKLSLLRLIYSIPIVGDIKASFSITHKTHRKGAGEPQEMILPHGAAIIYTPLWIEKEDFAFYPGTFLYLEEEILYYYVLDHDYKTIYSPLFKIRHLEDVSTNTILRNKRKKALFQIKQLKNSYNVLIGYLNANKLEKAKLTNR